MWPSLSETVAGLGADYATKPGEQQRVAIIDGVSLELNTRTRIAMLQRGIDLIAGEAFVAGALPAGATFLARAAGGEISFSRATLNIRRDDDNVIVSCLEGACTVAYAGSQMDLSSRRQVNYGPRGLSAVDTFDAEIVQAWRDKLLIFRDRALAEVIDEVNRYRRGPIILANIELGRRRVSGTFHLERIDEVLTQVRQVYGARVRTLPGGIAILS